MNFDQCFTRLLGNEGGHIIDPRDPGGETNLGICKRSYPSEDIAGMTADRARTLYLRDFWGPAGCDAMPDAAKFQVFDTAVNSGVRRAIYLVQMTVDTTIDGILGPITIQAVQSMPATRFVARFNAHRLIFMTGCDNWPDAGKGWARRVAAELLEA